MRRKNEIISIFGEIEEIVAKKMMAEGKGITRLAPTETSLLDDIPQSVKFNKFGDQVRMVIIVPSQRMAEFERRIEELRQ